MHLLSVKINEEYRTLPEGLKIELKPITLLVGEQGCGKSSLLKLLQENSEKITLELSDEVTKNGIESFFFDTETMNPRTADVESNYTKPDGTSTGIGPVVAILTRWKSHGEALQEFTVNRIGEAKNCVLLLDEPESALSVRNQYKLAKEINDAVSKGVQLIISTHCIPVIESVEEVYSLEYLRWMTSKEFIKLNKG